MTDFDKGVEYGITGFICGLVVQCLFFIPDWGVNKWIFSLVGIIIIIAMSVATYKDVMGESKPFAVGFIAISILFIIMGPNL
mgnify:CR=1 FL=1